jgi:hypothetical protein
MGNSNLVDVSELGALIFASRQFQGIWRSNPPNIPSLLLAEPVREAVHEANSDWPPMNADDNQSQTIPGGGAAGRAFAPEECAADDGEYQPHELTTKNGQFRRHRFRY